MKKALIPMLIGGTFALVLIVETISIASGEPFGVFAWWIILWAICLFVYFVPTYVAWRREHHALLAIFITNFFLGWTFIGWVAALIWGCTPVKPQAHS